MKIQNCACTYHIEPTSSVWLAYKLRMSTVPISGDKVPIKRPIQHCSIIAVDVELSIYLPTKGHRLFRVKEQERRPHRHPQSNLLIDLLIHLLLMSQMFVSAQGPDLFFEHAPVNHHENLYIHFLKTLAIRQSQASCILKYVTQSSGAHQNVYIR